MRTVAAMLSALLTLATGLVAQDTTAHSISLWETVSQDVENALQDASSFLVAPARFSQSEWGATAGMLATTAVLLAADETLQRNLSIGGRSSFNGDLWDAPTLYGSAVAAGGAALLTYAIGLASENDEIRTTGRLMGESLLLAGIPTLAVKWIAGRSRPYTGHGSSTFSGFQWSDARQSFPSGHSAMAFALSTVLAERIDNKWLRLGLYGVATLTAASRIHNNQHWCSDVFIGASLGVVSGLFVTSAEQRRTGVRGAGGPQVSVQPSAGGVTIVVRLN